MISINEFCLKREARVRTLNAKVQNISHPMQVLHKKKKKKHDCIFSVKDETVDLEKENKIRNERSK